jgi:hypothetical protein
MAPILIALEEHFAAQAIFDAATAAGIPNQLFPKVVMETCSTWDRDTSTVWIEAK